MCEPKPGSSHCEVTVPPAEPLNRPYRKTKSVWVSVAHLSRAGVVFDFHTFV